MGATVLLTAADLAAGREANVGKALDRLPATLQQAGMPAGTPVEVTQKVRTWMRGR